MIDQTTNGLTNNNDHAREYVLNFKHFVDRHPRFAARHPELVEKLNNTIKSGTEIESTGATFNWSALFPFLLMIFQLLLGIPLPLPLPHLSGE